MGRHSVCLVQAECPPHGWNGSVFRDAVLFGRKAGRSRNLSAVFPASATTPVTTLVLPEARCRVTAGLPAVQRSSAVGLSLLVLVAIALRVPGVSRPLIGNFATKNAVNAMIARNWALGRAPAWRPTLDCLAG